MGETYTIEIATAAAMQMAKLPHVAQTKVLDCFELLKQNAYPAEVEMLHQEPRLLRITVGDYRVVYSVAHERKVLTVLVVRHRRDAYRGLEKLDPSIVAKSLKPFLTGISVSMS